MEKNIYCAASSFARTCRCRRDAYEKLIVARDEQQHLSFNLHPYVIPLDTSDAEIAEITEIAYKTSEVDCLYAVCVRTYERGEFEKTRLREWRLYDTNFVDRTRMYTRIVSGEPLGYVTTQHNVFYQMRNDHYTWTNPDNDVFSAMESMRMSLKLVHYFYTITIVPIERESFLSRAKEAGVDVVHNALYSKVEDLPPGEQPTISHAQLRMAAKLAYHYHHAWAILCDEDDHTAADVLLARGTGATAAEIYDLSYAREDLEVGEPRYTVVMDDNDVVYESTSHRTRWRVTPDGAGTVWIQRPSGDCLKMTFAIGKLPIIEQLAAVYPRHVEEAIGFMEDFCEIGVAEMLIESIEITADDPIEAEARAQRRYGIWASDEPRPAEFGGPSGDFRPGPIAH